MVSGATKKRPRINRSPFQTLQLQRYYFCVVICDFSFICGVFIVLDLLIMCGFFIICEFLVYVIFLPYLIHFCVRIITYLTNNTKFYIFTLTICQLPNRLLTFEGKDDHIVDTGVWNDIWNALLFASLSSLYENVRYTCVYTRSTYNAFLKLSLEQILDHVFTCEIDGSAQCHEI